MIETRSLHLSALQSGYAHHLFSLTSQEILGCGEQDRVHCVIALILRYYNRSIVSLQTAAKAKTQVIIENIDPIIPEKLK